MINKYKRIMKKNEEKTSFWPLFTDMLASVLMVTILLLFTSESLAGSVKQDLASNVNNSLNDIMEDNENPIVIDINTGQITLDEKMLFDTDSYELKREAKDMLKILIPKYAEELYSEYSEYISNIIIEGHTDDIGGYLYNLELSQKRAYSVVEYIISDEIGEYNYKDNLTQDVIAIGRSEAELIKDNNDNIDRSKSRRVEIKYELNLNED